MFCWMVLYPSKAARCCRKWAECLASCFRIQRFSENEVNIMIMEKMVSPSVIFPCTFRRYYQSVQSLLCLTLCDPMDCSMPGFPVYHQFLELAQTHVHRVGNAIQTSHPLSFPSPSIFPSIRVFSNKSVLQIRWQSIGASASASVLPMNIQDWFPLGWTGWISLQYKGLSSIFSNTIVQKHQFFSTQLSL